MSVGALRAIGQAQISRSGVLMSDALHLERGGQIWHVAEVADERDTTVLALEQDHALQDLGIAAVHADRVTASTRTARNTRPAEVLPAHSAPARIADWSDGEAVMVRVGEVWDTRALTIDEIGGIQDSMYGWARFESSPVVSSVAMKRVGLHVPGPDGLLASHERELHEIQAEADVRLASEVLAITGSIGRLHRDICSVERLCIEPSPATSMCRRFDPSTPLGPALRAAQVQLATMGTTSGTIDGLAVSCSTLTPPSPYNRFCQTDGLPCTLPHDPTSISCNRLGVCGAQTPAGASDEVGDIIGAQWSGTAFTALCANDCQLAIESFPNSCYQERCGAGTGQCTGTESDTQCNTLIATNALGNPSCGGPFDCYGLISNPGPLDPTIVSAGQTIGGFRGCRRVGACSVGGACFAEGTDYEQCVQCNPTANSNALLSRSFGYRGMKPPGAPERCGQCGTGGACIDRIPQPSFCDVD